MRPAQALQMGSSSSTTAISGRGSVTVLHRDRNGATEAMGPWAYWVVLNPPARPGGQDRPRTALSHPVGVSRGESARQEISPVRTSAASVLGPLRDHERHGDDADRPCSGLPREGLVAALDAPDVLPDGHERGQLRLGRLALPELEVPPIGIGEALRPVRHKRPPDVAR